MDCLVISKELWKIKNVGDVLLFWMMDLNKFEGSMGLVEEKFKKYDDLDKNSKKHICL